MFTPLQRTLTYKNKTLTLREWAKKTGISYDTIYSRYRRDYPIEEILTRKPRKTGRPRKK